MPRDAEFDKLLYGSAGPPKGVSAPAAGTAEASTGAATPEPTGDYDMAGRVGRGLAKSFAGTATGIPRATNAMIGLASPSLREGLGNLAERAPGVKRAEEFAASPNETWAETAGYYGGEALQLFGPTELKLIAKLAERAPGLAERLVPRLAERTPGKIDLASAPAKMKAAEGEVFKPALKPVPSGMGEVERARGDLGQLADIIRRAEVKPAAATAEEITKRPIFGPQRTFAPEIGPSGVKTGKLAEPFSRGARVGEAGKVALKGAAEGAASGASTDPNDPGAGAALGAVTGGLTPLMGVGLQSRTGHWISDMIGRHGPYVAIGTIAHAFGVPASVLWSTGIAEFLLWKHAPGGERLGQFGRQAGTWLGKLLQRTPGTLPGAISGGIENIAEPRALGGDVQAGQPYMVGEQGPEMMIPQQSGQVMPNPGLQQMAWLAKGPPGELMNMQDVIQQGQAAGDPQPEARPDPNAPVNPAYMDWMRRWTGGSRTPTYGPAETQGTVPDWYQRRY